MKLILLFSVGVDADKHPSSMMLAADQEKYYMGMRVQAF